jgi:hypothetical protein
MAAMRVRRISNVPEQMVLARRLRTSFSQPYSVM